MSDAAVPVIGPDDDPDGTGPFEPTIVPPPAKPKRVRKSRAKVSPVPTAEPDAGATSERRPAVGRRPSSPRRGTASTRGRESIADGAAFVYGSLLGQALEATGGPLTPAGRAMQLNAPAFGAAMDDFLAGSVVDRRLQPLAKRGDKLKVLKDTAALPLMAAFLAINPAMYTALRPVLRSVMEANITALGPQLVKKKKHDDDVARTMRELANEGMLPVDEQGQPPTLDDLVDMLFAPVPGPPPAAEDEPQA